jgi:transcriptional regulator with XRE-family HTH domain
MLEKNIDTFLCLRASDAFDSLCGDDGKALSQKETAEKFDVNESVISEIKRCKREPSKGLIGKIIEICYAVDPAWLIIGKMDEKVCERVELAFRCFRINAPKELGVSGKFLLAVYNKQIMPSEAFLKRVSETCNAANIIYPQIDERFRAWFERTIIEDKIKTSELSDSLNIPMEYILAVLRSDASLPEELIAKFCSLYDKTPPAPAYSAYSEIIELLKHDPEAEKAVLNLLKKRRDRQIN